MKRQEFPGPSALARAVLLIRRTMGALGSRRPWVLGALTAIVAAAWIAACDVNDQPLKPLNPHPLPPNGETSGGDDAAPAGTGIGQASSSGGGSGGSSGGGFTSPSVDAGEPAANSDAGGSSSEATDAAQADAVSPPPEAGGPLDGAPDGAIDSGDAQPADASLDAP